MPAERRLALPNVSRHITKGCEVSRLSHPFAANGNAPRTQPFIATASWAALVPDRRPKTMPADSPEPPG